MADATCHYCERPAEAECATCGRLYCADHGDDVCLRCLAPQSAAPSAFAYRGSLVALGLASIVALFLFFRPPENEASTSQAQPVVTATPAFDATATPTEQGGAAPGGTAESRPTTTIATPTPEGGEDEASPTPEPDSEGTTYTIEPGDLLSTIAEDFDVTVEAILEANPEITDPLTIVPGQVISIPDTE